MSIKPHSLTLSERRERIKGAVPRNEKESQILGAYCTGWPIREIGEEYGISDTVVRGMINRAVVRGVRQRAAG